MSSRFLKDLIPPTVEFENTPYVLLKDREIRDRVTITTVQTQVDAFVTKVGKARSEANFFGDQSLVREKNVFMILQLSIIPRVRTLAFEEWFDFYNRGTYELKIVLAEKVTVDEDILQTVSAGIGPERDVTAGGVDDAWGFGRTPVDRRTYLITENKFVPGGRSIEFRIDFPEAAGNGLLVDTEFAVVVYGAEYERA